MPTNRIVWRIRRHQRIIGGFLMVQCSKWSDCGVPSGGCCSDGHFGGRPSACTCMIACGHYDGPSRGVGDTVAKVLAVVGVKKTSGCNCANRQVALNQMVPYKKDGV